MTEPHFRQRLWGYDREQVDAFVERTALRLDAADSPATPDGAVAEALERVGRETTAVLQRAHEVAAEVTARAQREAAELTERSQREAAQLEALSQEQAEARRRAAEHEAAEIVREAEAQANALDAEIESLGGERQELLADIERISQRLHALVSRSDGPPEQDESDADDTIEPARAVAARPVGFPAADAPARAVAAVPAHSSGGEDHVRVEASRSSDDEDGAGADTEASADVPDGDDQPTTEMPAAIVARERSDVRS